MRLAQWLPQQIVLSSNILGLAHNNGLENALSYLGLVRQHSLSLKFCLLQGSGDLARTVVA